MTTNLITTKSKKNEEWRQKYRWTLKEKFEDRTQTLEPGKRIKILQKNKDQATIRDEEGREFTIQTNQLVDFETFEEENSDPESEP